MTVGTDLTAVIMAVVLLLFFTFTLSGIYRAQEREIRNEESFRELLDLTERLQNSGCETGGGHSELGVLKRSYLEESLPEARKRWESSGKAVQIEVTTLEREKLYCIGPDSESYETTFSIPIVYQENGKNFPAFLTVRGR